MKRGKKAGGACLFGNFGFGLSGLVLMGLIGSIEGLAGATGT